MGVNEEECCIICHEVFLGERKVRHHDHVTGLFIGPAHNSCNLKMQSPNYLPIFFHNLSRYDSHILFQSYLSSQNIQVIPHSEEDYISFSIKICKNFWIRFVDSYRFLSTSLRTLVGNLPSSELKHTKKYFKKSEVINLITQKGYFCYNLLDNIEKLKLTKLPDKIHFKNELDKIDLTDDENEFT